MLEAYRLHPEAFTSDVGEREALPIDWWEKRLGSGSDAAEVVFAAFEGGVCLVSPDFLLKEEKRSATNPRSSECTFLLLIERKASDINCCAASWPMRNRNLSFCSFSSPSPKVIEAHKGSMSEWDSSHLE
ncbi:hypothetical protein ABMA08_07870 [Pseudomonas yamanorum]